MELTGAKRRKMLLDILQQSASPISGRALGTRTGVSRQVVVQDMALLRTQGYPIVSTTKGYCLECTEKARHTRRIKVCHTDGQVEDELTTIVDLGGAVLDVMVNHRTYGKMTAALNIRSRRDVRLFVDNMRSGKSAPLLNVTSGYHFHTITADSEAVLDEIEEQLCRKGYLADWLPYEMEQ